MKIKTGRTGATISAYPYKDDINDGSVMKVKLALQPGNGYTVGAQAGAKVKIVDNEWAGGQPTLGLEPRTY